MIFYRRRFLLRLPCYVAAILAVDTYLPARAQATATSIEVTLLHHRFVPNPVLAHPGARITFRNLDEDLHSIVLLGREDILEETFLDPGMTHSVVLPDDLAPSRYELACTIHVDMRAELVIG